MMRAPLRSGAWAPRALLPERRLPFRDEHSPGEIQCERRVPVASCRALVWVVARDDVLARFVRRM